MFATVLFRLPLVMIPLLPISDSPRDCQMAALTPQAIEKCVLDEFDRRVDAYVLLRRQLVWSLPSAHGFLDEAGLLASEDLCEGLVQARSQARAGDFFAPEIGDVLKKQLDAALLYAARHAAAPMYEPLPGEPSPAINERFPLVLGSVQWPALAASLPILPNELEYAFWGRDLVLVDVDTHLVVDVLPEALPEGARPGVLYQ
jgi:hypothetical protein